MQSNPVYYLDSLFILQCFFLPACIGWPLTRLLNSENYPERWLLSGVFGVAVLTIIASGGYRANIPMTLLYVWSLCLAGTILFFNEAKIRSVFINQWRTVRMMTLTLVGVGAVLVSPYWIGGLKFSLFQSSIWDQLSYTGAAMTYQHVKFDDLKTANAYDFIQEPVATLGAIDLYRRPAVSFLYALVGEFDPAQMLRWNYLFQIGFILQLFLAALFLLRTIGRGSWLKAILVSAALVVGFWGQIFVDIDAWSMLSALPILMAIITLLCTLEGFYGDEASDSIWALAILSGAALLLYPEGTMFHLPIFCLLAIRLCWRAGPGKRRESFIHSLRIVVIAGALAFYYLPTLNYMAFQYQLAKTNSFNFYIYFNWISPLLGRSEWLRHVLDHCLKIYDLSNWGYIDLHQVVRCCRIYFGLPGALGAVIDVVAGFSGVYFITPTPYTSLVVAFTIRILIVTGLLIIGVASVRLRRDHPSPPYVFIYVPILFLSLWFFILVQGKVFPFSRSYIYFGSYIFLALFLAWSHSAKCSSGLRLVCSFIIASQIGFGLYRMYASARPGRHYDSPYSMAEPFDFQNGKKDYDLNVRRLDSQLLSCREVYVDVPQLWQESIVLLDLYAHQIPFTKKTIVQSSIWAGDSWWYQARTGKENCTIQVDRANRLQLIER